MIIKVKAKMIFESKIFECQEYKITENKFKKNEMPSGEGVYMFGENPDFRINAKDKIYGGIQFHIFVDSSQYEIYVMSNTGETIDKYYKG